jgi:hypothetical protein
VLYRPESFGPLTEEAWNEPRVRDAIAAIVADADSAYDPEGLWPANDWDAWQAATPLKNLYCGAAGVVWALDALRRRGYAETQLDLAAVAARALELWRAEPDLITDTELPSPPASSLVFGETGILLLAWRLAPSTELADTLLERVRDNVPNGADELMWGTAGTLLAAHAMHQLTGEARWARAWIDSAEALLARRGEDGVWTQNLHGSLARYIGPAHGLVGNVQALLQPGGEANETLELETAAVLKAEAVVEDGLANWPALAGGDLVPRDGEIRVQWCHGAPGIVCALAGAPANSRLDPLLLAGGELVWHAGPLKKGAGLCHGTAGNGWAFLKLLKRTRDRKWLDRARRFAMHAIEQRTGERGLFEGDLGVALYVRACIDVDHRWPLLDVL